MGMKKYKLDEKDYIVFENGKKLYRIVCTSPFAEVRVGDKGGYVESEFNLSQNGGCWIYERAIVCDDAFVTGNARIFDEAVISKGACVFDSAIIEDKAVITNGAVIEDTAVISDTVKVSGPVRIGRVCTLTGDAVIESQRDYIVFRNNFSSFRDFIWTRSNNMWNVGCFYGTGEELVAKAFQDSEKKGLAYKAYVDLVNKLLEIEKMNGGF